MARKLVIGAAALLLLLGAAAAFNPYADREAAVSRASAAAALAGARRRALADWAAWTSRSTHPAMGRRLSDHADDDEEDHCEDGDSTGCCGALRDFDHHATTSENCEDVMTYVAAVFDDDEGVAKPTPEQLEEVLPGLCAGECYAALRDIILPVRGMEGRGCRRASEMANVVDLVCSVKQDNYCLAEFVRVMDLGRGEDGVEHEGPTRAQLDAACGNPCLPEVFIFATSFDDKDDGRRDDGGCHGDGCGGGGGGGGGQGGYHDCNDGGCDHYNGGGHHYGGDDGKHGEPGWWQGDDGEWHYDGEWHPDGEGKYDGEWDGEGQYHGDGEWDGEWDGEHGEPGWWQGDDGEWHYDGEWHPDGEGKHDGEWKDDKYYGDGGWHQGEWGDDHHGNGGYGSYGGGYGDGGNHHGGDDRGPRIPMSLDFMCSRDADGDYCFLQADSFFDEEMGGDDGPPSFDAVCTGCGRTLLQVASKALREEHPVEAAVLDASVRFGCGRNHNGERCGDMMEGLFGRDGDRCDGEGCGGHDDDYHYDGTGNGGTNADGTAAGGNADGTRKLRGAGAVRRLGADEAAAAMQGVQVCGDPADEDWGADGCPAGCADALEVMQADVGCCFYGAFETQMSIQRLHDEACDSAAGCDRDSGDDHGMDFDLDAVFSKVEATCGVAFERICASGQPVARAMRISNIRFQYLVDNPVVKDAFVAAWKKMMADKFSVATAAFEVYNLRAGSVIVDYYIHATSDDELEYLISQIEIAEEGGLFDMSGIDAVIPRTAEARDNANDNLSAQYADPYELPSSAATVGASGVLAVVVAAAAALAA